MSALKKNHAELVRELERKLGPEAQDAAREPIEALRDCCLAVGGDKARCQQAADRFLKEKSTLEDLRRESLKAAGGDPIVERVADGVKNYFEGKPETDPHAKCRPLDKGDDCPLITYKGVCVPECRVNVGTAEYLKLAREIPGLDADILYNLFQNGIVSHEDIAEIIHRRAKGETLDNARMVERLIRTGEV